ncbi:MAG: efflux RND transporter periplasmic adaptor subunit [Hyphomonadaceae bacterium]|nr:efflux RND transporter periplasmic adaptor subunit [Hyphomonadaceae bacterium]
MSNLRMPKLSAAQWLWLSAGVLLAVLLIWLALPRPTNVEAALIDRGEVRRTIVDEGRTRIHDVFVVAAPVGGELQRIALHPGDAVARGAIVATISPADPALLDARTAAEADSAIAAAQASLAAAEASAELAQRDQQRIARLAERGFASNAALDSANAALRAARANVVARRADVQRARTAAGRGGARAHAATPVRSPVSGRVLRILQESEGVVAVGAPLIEIGDPADLEVVAEFLSQDATLIQAGARASLEGWGGDQAIEARVARVEPYAHTKTSALGVEEQRVNVILRLADPASGPPLGHGFRLDARIIVNEVPDALRVPTDALVREGQGWAVFRIERGRARLRPVRVDVGDDHYRVVVEGLDAGDRVILFPGASLADGDRVRVAPAARSADRPS